MRTWDDLDEVEQKRLLEDYGRYNDTFPGTCSIDEKNARFGAWLTERDITYTPPATRDVPGDESLAERYRRWTGK